MYPDPLSILQCKWSCSEMLLFSTPESYWQAPKAAHGVYNTKNHPSSLAALAHGSAFPLWTCSRTSWISGYGKAGDACFPWVSVHEVWIGLVSWSLAVIRKMHLKAEPEASGRLGQCTIQHTGAVGMGKAAVVPGDLSVLSIPCGVFCQHQRVCAELDLLFLRESRYFISKVIVGFFALKFWINNIGAARAICILWVYSSALLLPWVLNVPLWLCIWEDII